MVPFYRLVAWSASAAIIALMVVPPALRPVTPAPHLVEHFMIFMLVGALFASAYPGREVNVAFVAIPCLAALELMQLFVPGRHARLADFVVNALGACIGLVLASLSAGVTRAARRAR
jgi:VanZ family protein